MKISLALILLLVSSSVLAETFCISHRGSFKSVPENTPLSLQAALDLNADGVEFDVQHTRDGHPILMHDKKLNTATHLPGRVCPLNKKIKDLSLKEIRLNCAIEFKQQFIPVPLLEEALEVVSSSGKFVFIELKDRPTSKTRDIIQRFFVNNTDKLRVIAFKIKNIDHLLNMNDQHQEFWGKVKALDLEVAPWGTPEQYGVNVWNRLYGLRKDKGYLAKEASVWTVNREKRIRKYFNRNINFITTDDVEKCQQIKLEIRNN